MIYNRKKDSICHILALCVILLVIGMLPVKTQAATTTIAKKSVTIKTKVGVSASAYAGKSINLEAATNTPTTLTFQSSNTKLATVTKTGVVKAVAPGTVKITITAKPKAKTYQTTKKTVTIRVLKVPDTFKVVYHYSYLTKDKTVTRTVKVGTPVTFEKASSLKFTNSNHIFIGWNIYQKNRNKWKVYNDSLTSSVWKKYDSENLYTFAEGYTFKEKVSANDELHLYGQWINSKGIHIDTPYFLKEQVKRSSGLIDSTEVFQKALDFAKTTNLPITIKIPKGNYYISDTLNVSSNTTLILDSEAVMHRTKANYFILAGENGNKNAKVGGYNQAKNISVKGGTWIGNLSNGVYYETSIMRFNHSQNITIKDCTFENYSGKHGLIFAGVKNGTVQNVVFQDQSADPSTKGYAYKQAQQHHKEVSVVLSHAESLHVDDISTEGEGSAYPIDGTVCDKITVKNCVFDDVLAGVGSHVKNEYSATDSVNTIGRTGSISVINNEFHQVKYICLNIYNKDNATIRGNKVYSFGQFMNPFQISKLFLDEEKTYTITDNDKTGMRKLYTNVLKSIKNYSFPHAGKNIKKYEYFLCDMNGDGIRELVVGGAYLSADKQTTFYDCIVFTCRKSSGSYAVKKLYGDVVIKLEKGVPLLYVASDGNGLLDRGNENNISTIRRVTISANTLITKQETTFRMGSEEAVAFKEANKKAFWYSSTNLTPLSIIK